MFMKRLIQNDSLMLRHSEAADLPAIVAAESAPENAAWVMQWPAERHLEAIADPDILHFVVQKTAGSGNAESTISGYGIMAGLESPHNAIELRRLVIIDKGQGLGRQTLRSIKTLVFEKLGAHRLWLDLFDTNQRARELYKSEGFSEEGLLRDHVYRNGVYHSFIVMSILTQEHAAGLSQQLKL